MENSNGNANPASFDGASCIDKNPLGGVCGKNPVNLSTRSKYLTAVDYQGQQGHNPIVFKRHYSSRNGVWHFDHDRRVLAFHMYTSSGVPMAIAHIQRGDGTIMQVISSNADPALDSSTWTWGPVSAQPQKAALSTFKAHVVNGQTVGFEINNLSGEKETFAGDGKLLEIEKAGHALTFTYDAKGRANQIEDHFGNTLDLSYASPISGSASWNDLSGPGQVLQSFDYYANNAQFVELYRFPSSITDGEVSINYGYTVSNYSSGYSNTPLLTHVTNENGETTAYGYGGNGGIATTLTSITGPDGQVDATYFYYMYSTPATTKTVRGNGLHTRQYSSQYVMDAYGNTFGFYNTTGINKPWKWYGTNPVPCPPTLCTGSGVDFKETTYDIHGNPLTITHFNGAITTMTWDGPRGLPLTVTQASGTPLARTTTYTWSPDHRNPLTITSPIAIGATTGTQTQTLTYNAAGNPLTKTTSNSLNSSTRVELWEYDASSGLLESHDDGQGNTATYLYDSAGNLVSSSNALGHTTTYANYTKRGNPRLITDPNGLQTVLTYDATDQVIQIKRGSPGSHFEISGIQYNPQGDIARITAPDGTYVEMVYDSADELIETVHYSAAAVLLGRKVLVRDLTGKITETSVLDAAGNTVLKHSFTYDAASRLDKALGAANQATDVAYTPAGDLATRADPLLHGQAFVYDKLRRLITTTDELNQQSHLDYDNRDNLVSATDARGVVTGYSYNAFSDLIGIASNDRGNWTYTRDGFGRITQVSGPRGETATPSYDGLGRVASIVWSDAGVASGSPGFVFGSKTATYTYDSCTNGLGKLCSKTDWTGTTGYSYDLWGRKVGEAFSSVGQGFNLTTGYSFDLFGRPDAVIYPSGKALTYAYGIDGRIASVAWAGSNLLNGLAHQAMGGPVLGWSWGAAGLPAGSSQVVYSYDQDGQMSHISDIEEIDVVHNLDGQVTGLGHLTETDRDMVYDYDARHRLVNADNALWVAPMLYAWDASSNRTSKSWDTDSWVHAYGAGSNRLVSRTPYVSGVAGTSVSPSYDAMGNVIANGSNTFSYDAAGRMVAATSGGSSAVYQVNAEGLRVRKTVTGPGAIDAFAVYDDQRRRVGTYRPDGLGGFTVDEELVYLPDTWRLIATVRGQVVGGADGVAWPVLTDHLGAPRALLDPVDGSVRWTWNSKEAFGFQAPNETPGSAAAFVFDARFPGQFLDAETGLFHNGYRDYSPQWGRYVQSDPIGLEAGWNTFEYVGGNPVGGYDPLGLRKIAAYFWSGGTGHVMLAELDGSPIINQYPQKPTIQLGSIVWQARNGFADTVVPFSTHPGQKPTIYVIDLKNDVGFDTVAKWNRNKPLWNLSPTMGGRVNSTNCVDAASSSLMAGGMDVSDINFLGIQTPAQLERNLLKQSRNPNSGITKVKW